MVENGKPAVTKVVTANKLLPSVLHGLAPLIPSALNSAKAKEDPGKVLLLESIEDDAPWYSYIKGTKDGELLEEACRLFPNYWKAYHRCALYHLYNKRTRKAFEVYTKAMRTIDDYQLHVCYLKFLYHMASIHEYIAALFNALDKVGMDHRSDPLWKEVLTILVKIYNCNLMDRNQQVGLLPNLFPSESSLPSGGGPLYPTESEQIVFRGVNTLDKKEQTYVQMYSEVNNIRKLFQRWLRTPTNNLKHAWEGYSIFENNASAANVLATKLLGDAKIVYDCSIGVHQNLVSLYAKVYPAKPATRRQLSGDQSAERNHVLSSWLDIIKYEESNPLNLPVDELVDRVGFTFRAALISYAFCSRLWYMYFQFLLVNNQREKGLTDLRSAIAHFLKDDSKMQFILAAHLDDVGETSHAATEFKRMIDPVLKVTDECEPDKGETQLRQLLQFDESTAVTDIPPIKLIHYLNFIRRNRGRVKWKEELQLILSKRELLSWDLCWYAADTELRCFKDMNRAIGILNQAQHEMPFDMHYTLVHLRFLLNMGRMVEVRTLLTEILVGATVVGEKRWKVSPSEKAQLWSFWFHTEYFYGSRAQYSYVQSLYITDKIANEVGLDTFAEANKRATASTIRQIFSDVGPLFMKTHMDSTKRVASADMAAITNMRRSLFCAGMDFDELDEVFLIGDKGKSPIANSASTSAYTESDEYPSASNFTRYCGIGVGRAADSNVAIMRPDVNALTEVNPGNPNSMDGLTTLHAAKRPGLPAEGRPLDSIATPPKVLFDLLRVLPTPNLGSAFPKMYANHEAIDYLIRSLDEMDFGSIPLKDYSPLPVNQLLHVKSTTGGEPLLPSMNAAVAEGEFDLNNGLFSILRFVEGHIGAEDVSRANMKRAIKKQKIAL